MPLTLSIPENRKPSGFQRVQKETSDMKWVDTSCVETILPAQVAEEQIIRISHLDKRKHFLRNFSNKI